MSDKGFIPNLYLPPEILTDERLGLRQMRVLMAIFSWRKSNTNLARVSRAMLAERTDYPVDKISAITTSLVKLGWIEKVGNGGKSQWSEYRVLDLQDVVRNDVNPTQKGEGLETVNPTQKREGLEAVTLPDLGRGALPNLGRGIDTVRNTAIKSSSKALPVDNFSGESMSLTSELRNALADFKHENGAALFGISQMTSPRCFSLVMAWQKKGVTVEDLRLVVSQVLARGVDLKSPVYLSGPMDDWLLEKSGEGEKRREVMRLPNDDNALEAWAKKNGYSKPKQMDTYFDYRQRLKAELRLRRDKPDGVAV